MPCGRTSAACSALTLDNQFTRVLKKTLKSAEIFQALVPGPEGLCEGLVLAMSSVARGHCIKSCKNYYIDALTEIKQSVSRLTVL